MPWNGTGTYTRGYASWTSDATNGLPISATKFDTEDNDFAAGIQNCLTIDNQNKPNAGLTWAQTLALTKGSDATVFSIARTGGSNNPSLTWAVADSADAVTAALNTGNLAFLLNPSGYIFGNATDKPTFQFTGSGITSAVQSGGLPSLNLSCALTLSPYQQFTINSVLKGLFGVAGAANSLITGDATGDLDVATTGGNVNFSVDSGATIKAKLASSGFFQISDNAASPSLNNAGYLGLPQNSQAVNYGLVLADRAKQILHSSSSAHTFTIPANASISFAIGDVLHFVNPSGGGVLTIAITTDTLTLVPAGSTGSRTLTAPGVATAEKINSTSWLIYGSNLT
jgi:hypothetical protein